MAITSGASEGIVVTTAGMDETVVVQSDLTAAHADDGGTQTNETTASTNATANDMTLYPTLPVAGDAYYFGHNEKWGVLRVNVGTASAYTGTTMESIWEYYNGSSWVPLSLEDNWGLKASLYGNNEDATDLFGFSVAINDTEDIIVIGAINDDGTGDAISAAGTVYVFYKDEGGTDNWGLKKTLYGANEDANDWFGWSVAIDGTTIVVGAYADDGTGDAITDAGSAYVFYKDEGGVDNWGLKKSLFGGNEDVGDHFGSAVAISGTTIVVGAEDDDGSTDLITSAGSAYVFYKDEGGVDNWGLKKTLFNGPNEDASDLFGISVAIDGTTIVVGASDDDGSTDAISSAGSAYVFYKDEGGTDNWGLKASLFGDNEDTLDNFGNSVAIDGSTIVVGARSDDGSTNAISSAGSAYVFYKDEGGTDNWGLKASLFGANEDASDAFGYSVAIDGSTIVVGARSDDGTGDAVDSAGTAYVFYKDEGGIDNWGLKKTLVNGPNEDTSDLFGQAVTISGTTIVVGARSDDGSTNAIGSAGSSYVFYEDEGVDDGTSTDQPFDVVGTNEVLFSIPDDWTSTTVNAVASYYIRTRCTTAPTGGTAPTGTQAWCSPLTEIVFSDDIITAGNGNLDASATYAGRLVILRQGGADEETRYMLSEAAEAGTRIVATISEPWVKPPSVANGDTVHVNYNLVDAENLTGLTFSNRTKLYTFSRRFQIGSGGGTFAFFALVDGDAYESVDNSSTTVGDTTVNDGALFQSGYLLQGAPVSGGYVFGTPALDGELVFDVKTGGLVNFYDFQHRSVFEHAWEQDGGTINWNKTKVFQSTRMLLGGTMSIEDSTIEGTNNTTDTVRIEDTTTIDGLNLVNTYGFTSLDDTLTETLTVKNVKFISTNRHIEVHDDKTWNVINPTWTIDPTTQDQLSFPVDDLNSVVEQYSMDITVQEPSGVVISKAQVFLYEGLTNYSLVIGGYNNEQETGADGTFSSVWNYKTYTYGTATTLTESEEGSHILKIYKYGKIPFVGSIVSNEALNSPITLVNDPNIVAADAATALINGAGITVTNPTNSNSTIEFTGGTGTLNVGSTVTGGTSGATGVVVEISTGDSTAGTIFLNTRNVNAFSGTETLTESGGGADWSGTLTSGSEKRWAWEVNCNNKTLQATYDYLAAKMASNPMDAIFSSAVAWGEGEQSQLLYKGNNGFYTSNGLIGGDTPSGVFMTNYASGAVDVFTSDDFGTFTPPATVNMEIKDVQANSKYRIEQASDGTVIADGTATGTEGTLVDVVESYIHTSNVNVVVKLRKGSSTDTIKYQPYNANATITSSGFSIVAAQVADPNNNS